MTEATETFRLTFDYLCPFARIANETVVEALQTGVDWDVTFHAFSLAQAHVVEGDPDVWEREQGAEGTSGVRALEWALAVRDGYADQFFDFHVTLFSARHDHAKDVNDEAVLREAVTKAGLNPDVIAAEVGSGRPLARLAEEHREAVDRWAVFGVPTFIRGDEAVFVRFMERHQPADVERVLEMLDWTRLNEFKRTKIDR